MAQKKHIKKSEEIKTVEAKPIPPYPKWIVWMVIGTVILWVCASVFVLMDPFGYLGLIPSFAFLVTTGCYGIYRAFRHYPLRSFAILDILTVAGIGIALCPTCMAPLIGLWPKGLTFDILVGYSVFLLLLLSTVILSCYGIYRAFRYYPQRVLIFLGISVAIGIGMALQKRFLELFLDSRSVIFLFLATLSLGQGSLSMFWKPARKIGWFIFYLGLEAGLAITGEIVSYVTWKRTVRYEYGVEPIDMCLFQMYDENWSYHSDTGCNQKSRSW